MADLPDGDWSTACTHYLLRASMRSARLSDLYDHVVSCVARGRISPAALRASAEPSGEARGREYAARVTALGGRWATDVAAILGIVGERPEDDLLGWSGDTLPQQLPRLARLWFELLDGLSEAQSDLAEASLTSALACARPSGLDAPFAVDLKAATGETASALLSLANTRSEAAVVRCSVTDVRRADGVGPSFVPRIAIAPGRLRLAADEEGEVRLSLRLEADVYEPGAPYLGAVRVVRRGESSFDVPLRIRAAGPAGGAP